jgi:hypothetical protein
MKIETGLIICVIALSLFFSGCANIGAPTGGPRDTIPPRLVTAVPGDSAKQFTGNKIVLNFDEYIDGKDIRTELLVTPTPKVDPIVDYRLRTVTIRLKDTPQPNTTYMLDFGKGIKDVDEDNVLKNFTYVFSTGAYIDRGEFSGNVLVANTGKADSTLVAILHSKLDDSAVIKDKPRYISRCDTTGRFHFRFVKPGTYALYALKDEGGNHKYLSKSQLFGFADSPVVVSNSTPPVTLYAYAAEAPAATTKSGGSGGASGGTGGTGGNNPTQTKKTSREKDTRLQVQVNISNGLFDVLDTFRLTFSSGLRVFDSTQIRFTDAEFRDIDAKQYRYVRDSTNKIFALNYPWPTDTKFHLILPRTFGQDSTGRKLLKDDTINFATKKDIEYGEIRIRVLNIDLSQHPVLQFISADKIKYAVPFDRRREVRRLLFPPGEYTLRVLYDTNRNGVWDPGVFFGPNRRQPEKVTAIRRKLNVKANWDNDVDIPL